MRTLGCGLAVAAAAAAFAAPQAEAGIVGTTGTATPGTYTWTVPPGATMMIVDAYGANGGPVYEADAGGQWAGGEGGRAMAAFEVSPGQVYTYGVGGWGDYRDIQLPPHVCSTTLGGAGGFGGGGKGGDGIVTVPGQVCVPGAGGGGSSWLVAQGHPFTDSLIVAGGGGGAAYGYAGGAGGGQVGAAGQTQPGSSPATGGSQTAGGLPGVFAPLVPALVAAPTAGSPFQGGVGASRSDAVGHGGGGGGWFGGGGATFGGGAGGSNHVGGDALMDAQGVNDQGGIVIISWGTPDPPIVPDDGPQHTSVGAAYSRALVTGGFPAPQVEVTDGSLPPGLTLAADGTLAGTPTTPGTYTFTLHAVNLGGFRYVSETFVVSGPPATVTAPSVLNALVGSSYDGDAVATVLDAAGQPVGGVTVHFALPADGSAGRFAAGNGTSVDVQTDGSGVAFAGAVWAGATPVYRTLRISVSPSGEPSTTVALRVTAPLPVASIADAATFEGNSRTKPLQFAVSLDHPSTKAVKLTWTTHDGTAVAPGDYVAATGTLKIPAGATSGTITVKVVGDRLPEADETFSVQLTAASGATLARALAVGTIRNDDN
jgi:hypothetical protein